MKTLNFNPPLETMSIHEWVLSLHSKYTSGNLCEKNYARKAIQSLSPNKRQILCAWLDAQTNNLPLPIQKNEQKLIRRIKILNSSDTKTIKTILKRRFTCCIKDESLLEKIKAYEKRSFLRFFRLASSSIPKEIIYKIINSIPIHTVGDLEACATLLRRHWQPLSRNNKVILKGIDPVFFPHWINTHRICLSKLSLIQEDYKILFPKLSYLDLRSENFDAEMLSQEYKELEILNFSYPTYRKDDDAFKKFIEHLPNLTSLHLSRNFSDNRLKAIGELKEINELHLSDYISSDDLNFLLSFKKLTKLDLSNCSHINDHLKIIAQIENLRSLSLFDCQELRDDGIKSLIPLKNLRHFEFSTSRLMSNNGLKLLGCMTNLTSLNFSINHIISRDTLQPLKALKNLTALTIIGHSGISELSFLTSLKQLTSLSLEKCLITENTMQLLSSLTHLGSLSLSSCIFDPVGLKPLKEFPTLTSLNFSKCNFVGDDHLKHLKRLFKLAALNLSECNKITADGLNFLVPLKNLRSLDLSNCRKIEAESIEKFKDLTESPFLSISS